MVFWVSTLQQLSTADAIHEHPASQGQGNRREWKEKRNAGTAAAVSGGEESALGLITLQSMLGSGL